VIVAKSECAGVAPDPCGCKCFFDAAWTCSGDEVVCTATSSSTLQELTAGDLLCTSRGSKKPTIDTFTQRVAGKCEKKPVSGKRPTDACLAKAQTAKEDRAAKKAAKAEADAAAAALAAKEEEAAAAAPKDSSAPATTETETQPEPDLGSILDDSIESFAAAATLVAVAALA